MELNLRKKYLYDLIKGMDEERLSKVETYIKRLCLAKQKESLYPWAPDEAELKNYKKSWLHGKRNPMV